MHSQPHDSRARGRALTRSLAAACALALAVLTWFASATPSGAATKTLLLTTDVPNVTIFSTTGCPALTANRTGFGTMVPGTGEVTSQDCDVLFGASNASSTLRAYQPDGRGDAMTAPATALGTAVTWENRAYDVDLGSATVGWMGTSGSTSNNRLYKTGNGGDTWSPVNNAAITGYVRSVDAVSATVAWALGYNGPVVYTTTGADSNWAATATTPPSYTSLYDIAAVNGTTAFVGGTETVAGHSQPRIWKTTNSGASWTAVYAPPTDDVSVRLIVAIDGNNVWAALGNGRVVRTTNGATFNDTGVNAGSMAAFAAHSSTRAAVINGNGTAYITTNGGTSWATRLSMERGDVDGAAYSPNGTLWLVGQLGSIQYTTDDGVTWGILANPHEGATFTAVASPANGHIVAVADVRTSVTTKDTGSTWTVWRSDPTKVNWRSIDGVDSTRLIMVGGSGNISTSTDGGTSWTARASPTTNALYEVVALDKDEAVAVGAAGTIIQTNDGGATWATIDSGTSTRLRAVNATKDGNTVVASGDAGTLLVSNDRGLTWSSVTTGVTDPITAVAAWTDTNWIFGTSRFAVRTTTNAGGAWTTRTVPTMNETAADAVAIPGTGVAYLLWDDNVSRTDDGGATWTTAELPGGGQVYDLDVYSDGTSDTIWGVGSNARTLRGENNGTTWSEISGTTSATYYSGVAALGPDSMVVAASNNHVAFTTQGPAIPDYTGSQWGTSSAHFGMCLRSVPGATNTWPTSGTCAKSDSTVWRGVPTSASQAAAKVGDLASSGVATASFRFGMVVPLTQAPGSYRAPIAFELIAPSG